MRNAICGLGAAMFLALAPADALSQPCWGLQHMMWGGGWLAMAAGQGLTLALLVALVVGAIVASRRMGRAGQEQTPVDILKARFARGEIDKAEFEDRLRILRD